MLIMNYRIVPVYLLLVSGTFRFRAQPKTGNREQGADKVDIVYLTH